MRLLCWILGHEMGGYVHDWVGESNILLGRPYCRRCGSYLDGL